MRSKPLLKDPFYRWGSQSMGMLSDLLKVTQHVDGGAKIQNQGTQCPRFTLCFTCPRSGKETFTKDSLFILFSVQRLYSHNTVCNSSQNNSLSCHVSICYTFRFNYFSFYSILLVFCLDFFNL